VKTFLILILFASPLYGQTQKSLKRYFRNIKKKGKNTFFVKKAVRRRSGKPVKVSYYLHQIGESYVTEGADLIVKIGYGPKVRHQLSFPRKVDKFLTKMKESNLGEVNFRVSHDELSINWLESYINPGEMKNLGRSAKNLRLRCMGTNLVKLTYDLAKYFKIPKIVLMSVEEAVGFYKKLGFESIDKRPGWHLGMHLFTGSKEAKKLFNQAKKCQK
jgi:hypothetical protein